MQQGSTADRIEYISSNSAGLKIDGFVRPSFFFGIGMDLSANAAVACGTLFGG